MKERKPSDPDHRPITPEKVAHWVEAQEGGRMPTIAVSGSRELLTLHDQQVIRAELVTHIGVIIHVGDCPTGVDAFMRDVWHKNIRKDFKADWNFGKRGGPERNGRMLIGVSVLLAFPGPKSKGTLDAIKQAIANGIETHVFPIGGQGKED